MSLQPTFDILERRKTKFVLWIPGRAAGSGRSAPPKLVLTGPIEVDPNQPAATNVTVNVPLQQSNSDLWELDPNDTRLALQDGRVYHYWFQITDTSSEKIGTMKVTDPLVYTVDYSTVPNRKAKDSQVQPAGVIKFRDRRLWPCDINGREPKPVATPAQNALPDNNHMVIYELPTSWSKVGISADGGMDDGTFTDVLALFEIATGGKNFKGIDVIDNGAVVSDLGTNALELLPIADAKPIDEWGYATAQYYAPDFDLGTSSELARLVEFIHAKNIRFVTDVVMAFGHDPYV